MNTHFSTSDFPLASTLVCLGYALEEIDKSNPKRATFTFHNTTFLEKSVDDFWRHALSVEPSEFFNSIKYLKTRLYDQ